MAKSHYQKEAIEDILRTKVARKMGHICPFIVHLVNILEGRLSGSEVKYHNGLVQAQPWKKGFTSPYVH